MVAGLLRAQGRKFETRKGTKAVLRRPTKDLACNSFVPFEARSALRRFVFPLPLRL
jgi:hypothetical protein